MKKLNLIILFVCIILVCTGVYKLLFHEINEEYEVLNKDVSLNNIKSIMEVEVKENENVNEIPLGYKDNKVYILKYNYEDILNKIGKYDNSIYEIDENGLTSDSEMNIPDEYCMSNNLSIYGNYIFCNGSYYDWTTGEKTIVFSDQSEYKVSSVAGNKDYFFYEKNDGEETEYYLVNIKSKDIYEYKVSNQYDNRIKDVFFDKDTSKFYGINYDDYLINMNLTEGSFSTEIYDDKVKLSYSNEDGNSESISNSYIFSDKGKIYFASSNLKDMDEDNDYGFNMNSYNLKDKYIEGIDTISVCGYDKYNSDCLLVKKKEGSMGKTYFAKFKNNNMDILMEVPKSYETDSSIAISMSDDANLLVSETYHNLIDKEVENKYTVYNLKEYFNDNEYVLNTDGTWTGKDDTANLQNTYKNIDESQRESKGINTRKAEDVPKSDVNKTETIETKTKSTEEVDNGKNQKSSEIEDYREHDPSWKKGNGDWYYFDKEDKKVTSGWVNNNGKWYYFDENGVMQKNALVLEHGCEFTLDENGVLLDSDSSNGKFLVDKSKEKTTHEENKLDDNNNEKEDEEKVKASKQDLEKNKDVDNDADSDSEKNISRNEDIDKDKKTESKDDSKITHEEEEENQNKK